MWSFLSCYLSCKRFTFDRIGLRGVFQNIGWRYAKARANPIQGMSVNPMKEGPKG